MHYYKRNLGDYAKKAGRLSMLQHGSYTLLLDACYDREEFPTMEQALEWTWASTDEEIKAVEFVLARFFVLNAEGVYIQDRVLEELLDYQSKADKNKQIAIERETKRAEKRTNRAPVVNGSSPEQHEPPPNHKPLTKNQEPSISPFPPSGETKAKSVRGTRLPENWGLDPDHETGLTEDVRDAARALKTELGSDWTSGTVRYHLNEFRNHFHASSQRNAVKLDWLAAWRNWCSKAMREMPSADPVRRDRQAAAARNAEAVAT